MQITINGQLTLMMLYEMISERIPGAIPLMQNTDGIETMIPKEYKKEYLDICEEWEKLTLLNLEHDEYSQIILPDVNNYIGVFKEKLIDKEEFLQLTREHTHYPIGVNKTEEGREYWCAKTKGKGRLNFVELALHKNKSLIVVRKAIFAYFIHGTLPEDYLKQNRNIFDYCVAARATGMWKFIELFMKEGTLQKLDVQKTLRYYVSNKGSKLMKINVGDGREQQVDAGKWLATVFNVHEEKPWEEYDINELFYLEKIYAEIKGLKPNAFSNQINLF
jgi:hypothetical protein